MNGDYPDHIHDFNELVFILSGSGIQTVNGREYVITAGDVFLLKGSDIHGFRSLNNMSLFNIGFKNELLASFNEQLTLLPGYCSLFYIGPVTRDFGRFDSMLHLSPMDIIEIVSILNKIEEEFKSSKPGCEIMLLSYFLNITTFISRKYKPFGGEYSTLNMVSVIKVLDYMENNYSETIMLQELSVIGNTPVSTLLYRFKRFLNTTPINYLNILRIKKAGELLINSDISVTDAAFACGFTDSNYFCRLFKKHMKVTPGNFRKHNSAYLRGSVSALAE
jgi:AraC-type DNA-binding domain-containing proteins